MPGFDVTELQEQLEADDHEVLVRFEGDLIADPDLDVVGEVASESGSDLTVGDVFRAGDVGETLADIERVLRQKTREDPEGYRITVQTPDGESHGPVDLDDIDDTPVEGGSVINIQTNLHAGSK